MLMRLQLRTAIYQTCVKGALGKKKTFPESIMEFAIADFLLGKLHACHATSIFKYWNAKS